MKQTLYTPDEVALSYQQLRLRVIAMLRAEGESVANVVVPHCPAWTVRETLSHLVGVPEDALSGNMDGVTTDAWTQAQIDRHANDSLLQLLDQWESMGEAIDGMVPHIPQPINSQFVFDASSHEHDIRAAIGQQGAQDALSVEVSAAWFCDVLGRDTHPQASSLLNSRVATFDFVRSLSGRRTLSQIDAAGLDANLVRQLLTDTPMSIPTLEIAE